MFIVDCKRELINGAGAKPALSELILIPSMFPCKIMLPINGIF